MLESYLSSLKGRRVGFVGRGISNLPILRRMAEYGIQTVLRDRKLPDASDAELEALGTELVFGEDYLKNIDEDVLFLAPAVRPDLPELSAAAARGVMITCEMREFFRLCRCPIYGVTGSDGKTTTSTLTAKLLEAGGKRVFLGGNIGSNLFCQLDEIKAEDAVVAELSSFQLMKLDASPATAVVTNIAPNHLDWHRGMSEYVDSKLNICRFQGANDRLVLNADDGYAALFAGQSDAAVVYTSVKTRLDRGCCYYDGGIYRDGVRILRDSDILLPGVHNRANYCEAIAAAGEAVSDEAIVHLAQSFAGVEHRCEFVREVGWVRYYNSSIDSSPSRTAACLRAFGKKVICICGGYDKKIPFEPLAEVCREKAKRVILYGATADRIESAFAAVGYRDYEKASGLADAVGKAAAAASPGDIVVLSPACASFDLFKNFEERGRVFKDMINNL